MGLASIFDHMNSAAIGHGAGGHRYLQSGRKMHSDNCFSSWRDCRFNAFRINERVVSSHVNQHRGSAGQTDAQRRGDKREGRNNHFVPGPTPSARKIKCNASVPLATPMHCFASQHRASSAQSARTGGPRIKHVSSITSCSAASTSSRMLAYCAFRSTKGICMMEGSGVSSQGFRF